MCELHASFSTRKSSLDVFIELRINITRKKEILSTTLIGSGLTENNLIKMTMVLMKRTHHVLVLIKCYLFR